MKLQYVQEYNSYYLYTFNFNRGHPVVFEIQLQKIKVEHNSVVFDWVHIYFVFYYCIYI